MCIIGPMRVNESHGESWDSLDNSSEASRRTRALERTRGEKHLNHS